MDLNQQIESLRQALEFSPENLPLRKLLCSTLYNARRLDEAEEEYTEALGYARNDSELKAGLAKTFIALKKFEAAQMVLEELIDEGEESAELFLLYSKVNLETNEVRAAYEYYQKAVEGDSSLVDKEYEQLLNKAMKESGEAVQTGNIDSGLSSSILEKPKIKFADVGGLEDVKEEIALKVIYPLKNPDIYKAFGKKTGGGILVYGPPGCGKTLLARATAGEIESNFISVGINEILDMWVGGSEQNLHKIFSLARQSAPCVLFFDEIDALGANRADMRHSASRSLINQFLEELDGVKHSNEGILVLGATNTPWYVDPGFRRPGRFDRVIFVPPPDKKARVEILDVMLRDKPTEKVDIEALAKQSEGYSGADLKAVVDIAVEAKLPESLKQNRVVPVTQSDLKKAIDRHKPTTKEWFNTACNYALYSNESGQYDDILQYLGIKK
ncbi:MAG: AAA family ATPase [Bacteroidota bacterium]